METVLLAAAVGLLIGSFLNVVIVRLPQMMERGWTRFAKEHLGLPLGEDEQRPFNLCFPASHCPKCRAPVAWFYNLPLLGFVLTRGHCAACGQAVSRRYPVVEGLCALLFGAVAWRYGSDGITVYGCLLTAAC